MRRTALLAALLLGADTATAAPPTLYCAAQVTRDYVTPLGYVAHVTTINCPTGGVARVRKASTLNAFKAYWPVFPKVGAINVFAGSTVDLVVATTYAIQFYNLPTHAWVWAEKRGY